MIRTEVLDCGARLVTERMAEARSATVGVWVGTGARDESPQRAGASHFLEHLLFKGTPSWTAAEIAEAVDEVGADMNAFTTKEYTAFYIRLLAEDLPLGLEVLGSIMTDPALRPAEIDAERHVILDEILMHTDEPADFAMEQCSAAMFPDHPLGRDVLGTAETVTELGHDEIRAFFDEHYLTGNLVIAAAGDVDHSRVADEMSKRFEKRRGGSAPARSAPVVAPCRVVESMRPTEQAHVVIGTRTCGRHDDKRWAVALLNHVLGGGISSRLFQEVREKRGLAYAVWSDRVHYEETGALTVNVGTSPDHAPEVLDLVNSEIDKLGAQGVTQRELKVARGSLRAETLLSLEDSGARMSRIGASLLLHSKVLPVDEVLARIDAVTLEDVGSVAGEIASSVRTTSTVGPVGLAGSE